MTTAAIKTAIGSLEPGMLKAIIECDNTELAMTETSKDFEDLKEFCIDNLGYITPALKGEIYQFHTATITDNTGLVLWKARMSNYPEFSPLRIRITLEEFPDGPEWPFRKLGHYCFD